MSMYCYQCEQTAKGTGCTVRGVCGKDAQAAALQDLLVFAAKGLARYAHRLKAFGVTDRKANVLIVEALFTTITNVNFDAARLEQLIGNVRKAAGRLRGLCGGQGHIGHIALEDLDSPFQRLQTGAMVVYLLIEPRAEVVGGGR